MRGFAAVGLVSPKTAPNIDSAMRAVQVFGGSLLVVTGTRYHRAGTDAMAGYRYIPLLTVSNLREAIPFDCVPVAVDLLEGATELPEYQHPRSAFYIFGPEDGTLGRDTLDWCRDRVVIPAGCLNLAAAVNIVLYDRMAKSRRVK